MARSITFGILALALASGCTLDLARLGSGLDTDGGDTDAGERDAGAPGDAGEDAGSPDGGCGCIGAGWQSTPFVVGGTGVSDVRVADLDGDGDGDIVASVRGAAASLLRLAVTGCGRLGLTSDPAEPLASAPAEMIVGVADWDGDGVRDILAPDPGAAALRVLRGNVSGGRYSVSRVADVPTRAGSFAAFALGLGLGRDGDDVIVLGDGGGTIAAPPVEMARALAEFRLTSTGSRVAFQSTTAGFIGAVAEGPAGIELVRFVPGGDPPIENLSVLPAAAGGDIVDVHFVDLDADGFAELVAVDGSRLLVYQGNAAGTFEIATEITGRARVAVTSRIVDPGASEVAVIALSEASSAVELLTWNGDTLVATAEITLEAPTAIAVADVDQDSQLDLVVGHSVGGVGRVSVLRRVCP